MSEITQYVGKQIRMYRKIRNMTLQQMAERIHKSRASVSKYENGEISIDVDTLAEIAEVLQVTPSQLMDMETITVPPVPARQPEYNSMSPFFQARRLYFYFYDARYQRLKDGIIDIKKSDTEDGGYEAALSISAVSPLGRSSNVYYTGKVVYSDMLIRFSFVNRYNALEEDLLYIFNPLDFRDSTDGLLCGISSSDLRPCAFRCLVTLTPQKHTEEFKKQLLITREEMNRLQKLNMFLVDNREC